MTKVRVDYKREGRDIVIPQYSFEKLVEEYKTPEAIQEFLGTEMPSGYNLLVEINVVSERFPVETISEIKRAIEILNMNGKTAPLKGEVSTFKDAVESLLHSKREYVKALQYAYDRIRIELPSILEKKVGVESYSDTYYNTRLDRYVEGDTEYNIVFEYLTFEERFGLFNIFRYPFYRNGKRIGKSIYFGFDFESNKLHIQ